MPYVVKEMMYTLQGEGVHAGRPSVFCRFAGCNLWTGREQDRASAICAFCDTDFVGTDGQSGGHYRDEHELSAAISSYWPCNINDGSRPFVVFTGGEPLLQLDEPLLGAVKAAGFETAVETNGTLQAPIGLDWVCVSPKAGTPLALTRGNELKLVFPQFGIDPESLLSLDFSHFFLQPMAGPHEAENRTLAVNYCLQHPRWKLSLQTHKILNIP